MNADKQVCGRRLVDEQADLVVEVFRMLSDSTRVQLLWALADRELSVNDSPDGSASRRRRCPNTWPSCGWRGWCAPGARAPRCSTDWRTIMSASSSPTRCTTPSTRAGGVPAHHLDDGELRLLHDEATG